MWAFE